MGVESYLLGLGMLSCETTRQRQHTNDTVNHTRASAPQSAADLFARAEAPQCYIPLASHTLIPKRFL